MMIVVIRANQRERDRETEGKERKKQAVLESEKTEKRTSFDDRCASLSYLKNRQDLR